MKSLLAVSAIVIAMAHLLAYGFAGPDALFGVAASTAIAIPPAAAAWWAMRNGFGGPNLVLAATAARMLLALIAALVAAVTLPKSRLEPFLLAFALAYLVLLACESAVLLRLAHETATPPTPADDDDTTGNQPTEV